MAKSKETLVDTPKAPEHRLVQKAYLILSHAYDGAVALLKAFDADRILRRPTGGQTTDEEQNLLRAMLVFAGAGLDASVKQVVKDSLPRLMSGDRAARASLATFIARRLRNEANTDAKGYAFLATALASGSPQGVYVEAYVEALTGESLQSSEQLSKAVAALGLNPEELKLDLGKLGAVFKVRNRIVHEMDIDFSQKNRRRYPRGRDEMIRFTNTLLTAGEIVLSAADAKLRARVPSHLRASTVFDAYARPPRKPRKA